nr:putative Ig domain-containing protein [Akkermansiaceae bacterium]
GVSEQRWAGATAYNTQTWTGTTNYSGTLATFTTSQNVADNYSRRLIGYLQPTVSGEYTFWIASDDASRLFLSTNAQESNKVQIASVAGWTNFQSWDSNASQRSAPVQLVAGQVYWLEVHHQEGGGGDHASVAWQPPGGNRTAIPASALFPNGFGTAPQPPVLALTSPGAGSVFDAGDDITLDANVVGGSLAVTAVEFYRGSTLIGSDVSAPYSLTWTGAVAGNHVLTARAVYSGGGVSSAGVSITVEDTDPAADPDGDGFTTGLELALGTDPESNTSQPPAIYAGLRAWWKLDDGSGSNADDTTGRAQDGAVSGAAWSSGITGGALDFDGTDDGVLVGNSAALLGTGDFSLSAWVKVDPGSSTGTVIQQREAGATGYQGEYMLNVNSNGTVNFFVYGTSAYQFDITTTAAINDGQWRHITALRSGTSGKIYIDGVEAASGSGTVQVLQSRAVSIGYDHRDLNKRFDGGIDDVRIYERALSAAEIDSLHGDLVPNRAPAFTADPVVKSAATEDASYSGSLAADTTDPDFGDTRTFAKVSGPSWLSVSSDGTLSGTPSNSDVGSNSFTVRVTDAAGLSDDAGLSITVTNANDAPVFAADPISGGNVDEDSAYSGTLAGSASDVDAGDNLSYSKVNGPAWLNIASNGTLSGTPGNDDVGPNSFTVRVTDGGGLTDEAGFEVTVINVNDAPAFTADPITGAGATEDTAYVGSLAASDIDSGDTLTFAKISGPGWLSVAANGALSGLPSNSDVGSNSFTIRVTDAAGAFDDAVLNIAVANVNDAPVFTVDPILRESGIEEIAYVGTSLAGLAVDVDAGDGVTYSKASGPAWLTVSSAGQLGGTPPAGSAGSNAFTVRATDSAGAFDEATLTIEIEGPSLPLPWQSGDVGVPLAGSVSYGGGLYDVTGAGILSGRNDAFHFVHQTLSGDGEIIARVSSLQNTGTSSRVGVMIRDTLATNSRHVFMGLTGSNAYRWVRRTSTNGTTSTTNSGTGTVPNTWVRLRRVGNVITAFRSANGTNWTQVGSVTATLPSNCYVGLVVASGSNTTPNSSAFDQVTVTP